ncbi:MAG: hypothetical protein COT90_04435 [Candidatus Diapherotrites archaeon CG10_big_fil_rev_8_21_14_0_10_31_34]|nr:MAG: hypothetical protein COT90_04435 [Candidatus Diapherotrites archaeon CG10_big_fil_rev_8_21_14_0_10_31_34]PJA20027.1 MAG: hypothetical protein COX63_01070 [Candidatus Diapherotrites archaeon CG_4_10_14_0_2_um_filter_31_5]
MKVITFDLHTHLNEKNILAFDYWKRVKEIGLDAVAITEHNFCDPKGAFDRLNKTKPEGILLIPGIEINSSVGHALVYGKDESLYNEVELLEDKADIERVLELVKEKGFYFSFAHPFGYEHDSVCFLAGEEKTKKLIKKYGCGVEIYNGMVSQLSNFLYDSQWITKPFNFVSFMEKNIVSRKIGLGKVGGKIKKSFDSKREDIVMRCIKAIELGNTAGFITAGSDSHSAERIGTGIMKLKLEEELTVETIFNGLKKKENIIWSGPLIKETEKGVFEKVDFKLKRMEIAQGIQYITQKAVKKSANKIPTKKIKGKISGLKDSRVTKKIKSIKFGERIKGTKIRERIGKTRIAQRIKKISERKKE